MPRMRPHEVDDLLKPREVARLLNISPRTLEKWRFESRGPSYFQVEGGIRYSRREIAAYVELHRVRHQS